MRAVVHERYGVEAVTVRDVPQPEPGAGEVLLRVHASSVNPAEWYAVAGPPFVRLASRQLRRPKDTSLGFDVAGTVEAVGSGVTTVRPGDAVFGSAKGAWAEHAVASVARLAPKPAGLTFEDAAAVPIAGLTALQALRDHGAVRAGRRVLVNGASGGVGTYAVQIAKALGADVTAVCSTRHVDLARSLGADRVVDYTQEDFTGLGERFDAVVDIAGSRSFLRLRRILTRDATVVVVGAKMSYSLLGPLKHVAGTFVQSLGRSQKATFFVARVGTADLAFVGDLMERGEVRSVIDRRYELSAAGEALRHLAEGHPNGKIVLTV